MNIRELVEEGSLAEEAKVKDSSVQPDVVKLVEMGDVSIETKGTAHGLELGYTPRNF
jgi:hypothetical protein